MPRQFIKFGIVGSVNTLIDFLIYFGLTRFVDLFSDKPVRAKIIAFIFASAFSYYANRNWTFKKSDKARYNEIIKFYITAGIGLAINASTLYILVHIVKLNDLIAYLGATIVTVSWNFFISKYWVFSHFSSRGFLKNFFGKNQ